MKGYTRIHGIAHCQGCDWQEGDFKTCVKEAEKHHKETNHTIDIELGFWRQIK